MMFVAWALPVMGATLIITCSTLFKSVRKYLLEKVPKLGELVNCPMCTGFWIGVIAAIVGIALPISSIHHALDVFANGCAASFACWSSHIVLCRLGQAKYLSSRPDLKEEETLQPKESKIPVFTKNRDFFWTE